MQKTLRAIEFFSGIGAFSQAVKLGQYPIEVVQAFDQSEWANKTFAHNNGLTPHATNLDTIKSKAIKEADIWWMSPPCTPYSRRGLRKDLSDPRAASFQHLLKLMPEHKPQYILIENVEGFIGSQMEKKLHETLQALGYKLEKLQLCPSQMKVPMLRPRLFIVAVLKDVINLTKAPLEVPVKERSLLNYLSSSSEDFDIMPTEEVERYTPVLNIVDPREEGARAICFTSGYYRCRKAAGSLLRTGKDVRYFQAKEILRLLGFSEDFQIPAEIPANIAYRLVGNSVDTRSIRHLLDCLLTGRKNTDE